MTSHDALGYGRSIPAGRDRDISVAAQARYLNAWLDHLDVDRTVLAGHDLGGGVVQIAAVDRPQRCVGLMLTNTIARGHDDIAVARESFDIHHRHYTDHDGAAAMARQVAAYGQRLARDLGARATGIRRGKHFTPEDHPHVVAAAIKELVNSPQVR